MSNYTVKDGNCIITDYEKMPAFSEFLPGLTGEDGIPMWVFYTNRGQAIGSLGINSKNNAIMEFFSANAEYENTELKGFRTFVRVNGSVYEPFRYNGKAKRSMTVRKNSFEIKEEAPEYGIQLTVNYFVLPREPIGALVRCVTLKNIAETAIQIELLDGAAKIIPNGISNGQFKDMSNLFKSWTDVRNLENNAPFFAMRASTDDSAEVEEIRGGYFYMTAMNGQSMPVIVDPVEVFGYDNSLCYARGFESKNFDELNVGAVIYNEVPCAFTPIECRLNPGEAAEWSTYLGYAGSVELLNAKCADLRVGEFSKTKFEMANEIAEKLTSDVGTHTSSPEFDAYIGQSYMDNFLRGGYPTLAGDERNPGVLYLYSRKHGDPERDYNWFSIDGEFYSQGNGNFRDVCQNRRNDVFFCPGIGDYNVKYFFSLMQMDGYNPLEIRPATFTLREACAAEAHKILFDSLEGTDRECGIGAIMALISGSFRPGEVFRKINEFGLKLTAVPKKFVSELLALCSENIEAGASEGYWSDHWDYLMDLIDNYLLIYPDKTEELVFGRRDYRYYDSEAIVLPRSETYFKDNKGTWQYGSMGYAPDKKNISGFVPGATNWKKNRDGSIVEVNLAAKLVTLVLNKFSSLDSFGMGIEMEGGKPGWNDAMNGLPAMFGSSMAETFELVRMVRFLCEVTENCRIKSVSVPREVFDYFEKVETLLQRFPLPGMPKQCEDGSMINTATDDFTYWDEMATVREQYREGTNYSLSGETVDLATDRIRLFAGKAANRLEKGIEKACLINGGRVPTYFTFTPVEYETVKDSEGRDRINPDGRVHIKVLGFSVQTVPCFLEGYARYMNGTPADNPEKLHKEVMASELYDRKLKMFRTSESLEKLGLKYGRIRAFTPGWLERESVFLHMEYKYLVALQRSGLYREFYESMNNALIPFLNPEMYGRSTLENSSFIASSANPNPKLHGRGFVARLSGSTTEVLTMWIRMFLGEEGFTYSDGVLKLRFAPRLQGNLFDEKGEASWTFMGGCRVIYKNASRKDTFGTGAPVIRSIKLWDREGCTADIEGDTLTGELAYAMRDGKYERVEMILS